LGAENIDVKMGRWIGTKEFTFGKKTQKNSPKKMAMSQEMKRGPARVNFEERVFVLPLMEKGEKGVVVLSQVALGGGKHLGGGKRGPRSLSA